MSDEIDQLLLLLNAHRRTTGIMLVQRALAGTVHVAPSVETTISEGRSAIKNVKDALRSKGYAVEDIPIIDDANDMQVVGPGEVEDLQHQIKALTNQTIGNNQNKYFKGKSSLVFFLVLVIFSVLLIWLLYDRSNILSAIAERDAQISSQSTNIAISNTQIATSSPTQTIQTDATISYSDTFDYLRNDGIGIESTSSQSLTSTLDISQGYFVIQIDSVGSQQFLDIRTNDKFSNFEMIILFGEITNNNYLSFNIGFRENANSKSKFGLFIAGNRKGGYYMSINDRDLPGGNIVFDRLEKLRIRCVDTVCTFYINSNDTPFATSHDFINTSGTFRIGASGQGIIRIDEISIFEIK